MRKTTWDAQTKSGKGKEQGESARKTSTLGKKAIKKRRITNAKKGEWDRPRNQTVKKKGKGERFLLQQAFEGRGQQNTRGRDRGRVNLSVAHLISSDTLSSSRAHGKNGHKAQISA